MMAFFSSAPVQAALNLANVAAQVSPVPGAAIAVSALSAIASGCEQVQVHKQKARRLRYRCNSLLLVIQEAEDRHALAGHHLQEAMDKLGLELESYSKRIAELSKYKPVKAFFKQADIEECISTIDAKIEDAMTAFHIRSQVSHAERQVEVDDARRRDNDEMQQLLRSMASTAGKPNSTYIQEIYELERDGEEVTQFVVQAAQQRLQSTPIAPRASRAVHWPRRSHDGNITPIPRTESPTPMSPDGLEAERESLRKLIDLLNIPPSIKLLNGGVKKDGDVPYTGTQHSEVWKGIWEGGGGIKVAMKGLKQVEKRKTGIVERFEREIRLWSLLNHPNILPLLGLVTDVGPYLWLVSPWQENGSLDDYVKYHSGAFKEQLLFQAAQGMTYLHATKVVHGNLRCANIMVLENGTACISDFGMAKVMEDVTQTPASQTLTTSHSSRWVAPEVVISDIPPTFESDVWSFSMTIYETMRGRVPFWEIKTEYKVTAAVMSNRLPVRPQRPERVIDDVMWNLITSAWCNPEERPTMQEMSMRLKRIVEERAPLRPRSATSMETD